MRKPAEPAAGPYRGRTSEDYPAVRFDPERRQNFHEEGGVRIYHETPAGYEFDAAGVLQEVRSDG